MSQEYSFNDYQRESRKTALYPEIGHKIVYPLFGLLGEAGEISEKVKKIFRDKGGVFTDEDKEMIKKELGDVMWYVSQLAYELDIPLEEVATHNIEKLQSRMQRNMIHGDGDNR
jgi:NTP pyrophosphatase (non-canonical NTP hydrolase)